MKQFFDMGSVVAVAGVAMFGSGCAAEASDAPADAPESRTDNVESRQTITNVNSDGTWTATANQPGGLYGVASSATFTGPAGKTRKMGVCLLTRFSGNVACNTVADCGSAPVTLPAGGSRYCTAPDGVGQKYCFYRPGTAAQRCAGTPADGVPIAAGSYSGPGMQSGSQSNFISYACFEGCAVSDPSASSPGFEYVPPKGPR